MKTLCTRNRQFSPQTLNLNSLNVLCGTIKSYNTTRSGTGRHHFNFCNLVVAPTSFYAPDQPRKFCQCDQLMRPMRKPPLMDCDHRTLPSLPMRVILQLLQSFSRTRGMIFFKRNSLLKFECNVAGSCTSWIGNSNQMKDESVIHIKLNSLLR